MTELKDGNGNYTEAGLHYPGMKANLELCKEYLSELCNIVWGSKPNRTMWSIPPRPDNFDMQLDAAFDELQDYRSTGFTPEEIREKKGVKNE